MVKKNVESERRTLGKRSLYRKSFLKFVDNYYSLRVKNKRF